MAYYQPSYSQPGYAGQPSPSGYPATSPGYTDQSAAPGYPVHYYQPFFSNGTPPPLPPRRPPPATAGAGASSLPTTGQFEGVQFHIDHRDSNAMLYIQLESGVEVKAKSGSMVAMDATVKIKGKLKFSVAKLLSGENMSESTFTGPGQVLLAPATWGDIVPIHLDGHTQWSIGKDAYLACTIGVTHKNKSQGVGKALLSGEFLSAYNVNGAGILWVTSLGAIYSRTLQPDEQWIVDKGHLVAWTATCKDEDINAGGRFSRMNTDEDSVCRFTGPGIVYIQTRNPETLGGWINDRVSPPDVYHVVAKTLVPGS